MKNKLIIVMIFLVTATAAGYAQIFKPESESAGSNSSLYENSTGSFEKESSGDYGGFFRTPSADDPGDRPGTGEGIGQNSPISDGIHTLAVCCFIYGLLKVSNKKRKL